jgi:hypothetical protein
MPYQHNDADNQTQDRVLAWQKEWEADIVADWDSWPLNSGLTIREAKNKVGGQLRWLVNVNAPVIQGTAYVAPDYTHSVIQRRVPATLDFVEKFSEFSVPEGEKDYYSSDPAGYVDIQVDLQTAAMRQMYEDLSDSIWNGTGVLPGVMTGLDVGINDAVGANIYAGVNRTTYPRWEANVDRTAFALWAGTVSTNIWPLYLRSKVNGKRPDVMVCSMSPLTAFHRLMENRQYNTKISPSLGKQSQYHGEPTAMTFMDMHLEWGGDNMPAGTAGVDIFGLRMDDICLEHASSSLIVTYPWTGYQNNHLDISKIRTNCQYAVHCPENHFRVIDATVPDDPTTDPAA